MTPDADDKTDPTSKHDTGPFPEEEQGQPGITREMKTEPDHGEDSYEGSGRLAGRSALITGGDSGIGRAVAIAYAREGADVAIVYLPEEQEDAEETSRWVQDAGRTCVLIPGDLRDERFCAQVVEQTVAEFGKLDILVSNAAYQKAREGIENVETAEFERVFTTNLSATIWLMRAAVPRLESGSSIIITSSIQAFDPSPELFDYAMTKAALVSLTKSMGQELAPRGIRVNSVAPGPIWTPLIPATDWDEQEKVEQFGSDTPLGRAGQPAELAGAYVYLASEQASYVAGAVLPVTGGRPL
ncbi:glucose 1-dehydrogenase [Rathayibacter sp. YIM 133350]|uniref:glucose 1-dehydrogenase n=1 Tax=Rathayibacter sp. YIM 133350 TaxID=3131992 RepID=UPI00307FC01C